MPSLVTTLAFTVPDVAGAVLSTMTVAAIEIMFTQSGFFFHKAWSIWYTIAPFPVYYALLAWFRHRILEVGVGDRIARRLIRVAILFLCAGSTLLVVRGLSLDVINVHMMPT